MSISMSDKQSADVATELERVFTLALEATKAGDTTAMISKLRSVSGACLNAVQVIRDVEADIRTGASTKEHA